MSRIGNKQIDLAEGITVDINKSNFITVKGPKGNFNSTS